MSHVTHVNLWLVSSHHLRVYIISSHAWQPPRMRCQTQACQADLSFSFSLFFALSLSPPPPFLNASCHTYISLICMSHVIICMSYFTHECVTSHMNSLLNTSCHTYISLIRMSHGTHMHKLYYSYKCGMSHVHCTHECRVMALSPICMLQTSPIYMLCLLIFVLT